MKKWLRELRAQAELTQTELAEIVEVDDKTIKNMEKDGASLPQGFTMIRILRALGAVADAPERLQSPLELRLQALEERVASLPTTEDQKRTLGIILAAIQSQANQGTGESGEAVPG